jgi:hypothetical protein
MPDELKHELKQALSRAFGAIPHRPAGRGLAIERASTLKQAIAGLIRGACRHAPPALHQRGISAFPSTG